MSVEEMLPEARRLARAYTRRARPWVSEDELRAAALYGLARALTTWDPARGAAWRTYAKRRMEGEVVEELRTRHPVYWNSRHGHGTVWQKPCGLMMEDALVTHDRPPDEYPRTLRRVAEVLSPRHAVAAWLYWAMEWTGAAVGRFLGVSESRVSHMLSDVRAAALAGLVAACSHAGGGEAVAQVEQEAIELQVDCGLYAEAEARHREALALDPENQVVLNNLAAALHVQGRLAEAEDIYRDLLARGFEPARLHLGICLRDQGRLEEARACVEDARGDPDRQEQLAVTLTALGYHAAAAAEYGDMAQRDPDPVHLYNWGESLTGAGLKAEAWYLAALARAPEADPLVPYALDAVARSLRARGEEAQAVAVEAQADDLRGRVASMETP